MRITSIALQNIKSFYEEESWQSPDNQLNILIGPNAGGKSNLLEILQGTFNSLIFRRLVIEKAQQAAAYQARVEGTAVDTNPNLRNELFDYPLGAPAQNQEVTISCKIEGSDVDTIQSLGSNFESLSKFELSQTGATAVTSELRRVLDVIGDASNLRDATFDIKVNDQAIQTPSNQGLVRVDGFFQYLQLTSVLSVFINNFYNLETDDPITFRPSFTYLAATRVPINIGSMDTNLDLAGVNDLGQMSYSQYGHTAESVGSHFDAFRHRLVLNHHLGKPELNEPFIEQLKELELTFNITRLRRIHSEYKLKFERLNGGSPKLSTGEKELFNLLSLFYVQDLQGGIVVIDEPEMHLHPRWQKKFLKLIKEYAENRDTQFILVTHSSHLVDTSTINNITRVYKDEDGRSHIVKPSPAQIGQRSAKDVFQVVNALSNEKIYFADKVVLVEGPEDRVILERAFEILQAPEDPRAIEVVEVGGKTQFDKFVKHLEDFAIDSVIVADFDYISDIGSADIKSLLTVSRTKLAEKLKKPSSLDGAQLVENLDALLRNSKKKSYSSEDLESLRQLYVYLQSRYQSIRQVLTDQEKRKIEEFISSQAAKKVYIWSDGAIESVFGDTVHYDIEAAINKARVMIQPADVPMQMATIVKNILTK